MKYAVFLIFLFVFVCGCKNDKAIEIYRMNKLNNYRNQQFFVIYNHRGKTDNELINSVIDYNRATISIDTILNFQFFRRTFFLKDKILTRDFEDGGEDYIMDYAYKKFIDIAWDSRSKYKCSVYYLIRNKRTTPEMKYWLQDSEQRELLLNPIPRR